MVTQNKKIGMEGIVPPVDSSLEGAPATVPGSGNSEHQEGHRTTIPASTNTAPPPIDSSLDGAPNYVASTPPAYVPPVSGNDTQPPASKGDNNTPSDNGAHDDSGNQQGVGITSTTTTNIENETETPVPYMSGYEDIIPYLEAKIKEYHPKTKEELEKERRKQRTESIISGISDAVRAVANLFYTTQYAPNMYNAGEGMSARAKARFDKEAADRKARDDEYFNYAMTLGKMKHGAAQEEREWRHTLEREKIEDQRQEAADARAQAKADRDAAMAELRMKLLEGKITQQEAAAAAEKIEADYAAAYWQSRINKNNYRPVRSGGGSRSGGGGKPAEYPWYDSSGNKHYAHSYEAARQNSLDNETWTEGTQQSTSQKTQQKGWRTTKTTTQTTRTGKGHSTKPKKKNRLGL